MRIIIILIVISAFSCRSVQYVPVKTDVLENDSIVKNDSIYTDAKTTEKDSSAVTERVEERDSVVIRDSSVTVIDTEGNVVKTERYREKESYNTKELQRKELQYRELESIYKELQSKYETLLSQKQETVEIPYPVEVVKNKVPGIMWWLIIILSACSIPFVLKIIRFIRGKI